MSRVRFEITASLDGYVTAANPTPHEPMGAGGQVLHQLAFSADEAGRRAVENSQRSVGASIAGRRTYDTSIEWWRADGPGGELRTPTFIVSHSTPDEVPANGVYTFVSSPEQALEQARAVAGDKDVDIFSARIGEQLLRAGLVDEVHIHLVPVLLGDGTRLIGDLGGRHVAPRAARLDAQRYGHPPPLRGRRSPLTSSRAARCRSSTGCAPGRARCSRAETRRRRRASC